MVTKASAGNDEVETWAPSDPAYFIDPPRPRDAAGGKPCLAQHDAECFTRQ